MRGRLFRWILLIAVPVLFALAWYMSEQSFQLSLTLEKQRTQLTQSVIFQDVRQSTANLNYSQAADAARQYRASYAAQGIELIFCWNGMPIAGAALPNPAYKTLLQGRRAAMLDTSSRPQRYAVAEPVNGRLTMLLLRDVSGLYTLRDQFRWTALLAALGASLLLGLLGFAAARFLTQPIRNLTDAADRLSQETGAALFLPTARNDEIGALARAFDRMQTALKSREEALRQESDSRQMLLDALAHEMRTPLTSLLGNARLMQKELPAEARGEIGDSMVKDVMRLTEMDQQLMKLTRMRQEEIEQLPVSVLPLLRDTARRLSSEAENRRITVAGEDSVIAGDAALLSLLADNLAVNALRASDPGQEIVLTALPHGFSVADHGIGMTQEQIAHACEPFWKADKARTRSHGGAGLGLALCKRIADLHGGQLIFSSELGKGTTVQFVMNDP